MKKRLLFWGFFPSMIASPPTTRTNTKPTDVTDIDKNYQQHPQWVAEYAEDIFRHLKEREHLPDKDWKTIQPNVTPTMLNILMDWLVEVHTKFKLFPETLYLTVHLIHQFLLKQPLERQKLQLIGSTCMLLASKYHEIYFPEIRDFVYICDGAYKRKDFLKCEILILSELDYQLTQPTIYNFLGRYIQVAGFTGHLVDAAHFIAEQMLVNDATVQFLPSLVAAATVYWVAVFDERPSWTATLAHYTGYKKEDVQTCANVIRQVITTTTSLKAVIKKYSITKHHRAASKVRQFFKEHYHSDS